MTRIVIIGGGIGGLTAGIALQQAGLSPQIYEQAANFAEVGAGISLSPNAVKGLESLGLSEFLAEHANEPLDQFVRHGTTGETLLHFDRRSCRQTHGAAYYQLHRADLLAALVARFGRQNFHLAKSLANIDAGKTATLRFADGSTTRADAVIAADGLRSVVRTALFEPAPPLFSGHVAWRALIPATALGEAYTQRSNINHVGPGRNLVTYPVRGRSLVNLVALTQTSGAADESWTALADKSALAEHFAGWTDHVTTAIAAIPGSKVHRWGLFIREPLMRWHHGRVALLGDAAHPMLPYMGQGASSAIEDATILGRCFAARPDPEAALALYAASRIARASFLQAESNLGGARLQALDPYALRDSGARSEDSLGIFAYDPTTVPLGQP